MALCARKVFRVTGPSGQEAAEELVSRRIEVCGGNPVQVQVLLATIIGVWEG